jgi:hypothetical protein
MSGWFGTAGGRYLRGTGSVMMTVVVANAAATTTLAA